MSDELKAKLAAAEAEVQRLRNAAEQSSTASEAMRAQIIRSSIVARHPVDVEAIEALVSRRIAMSESGEMFATDANGAALVGSGPGHTVGLDAYLDQLAQERPALFKQARGSAKGNPFEPGPGQNLTEGMKIFANDPALGRELMDAAGYDMRKNR